MRCIRCKRIKVLLPLKNPQDAVSMTCRRVTANRITNIILILSSSLIPVVSCKLNYYHKLTSVRYLISNCLLLLLFTDHFSRSPRINANPKLFRLQPANTRVSNGKEDNYKLISRISGAMSFSDLELLKCVINLFAIKSK